MLQLTSRQLDQLDRIGQVKLEHRLSEVIGRVFAEPGTPPVSLDAAAQAGREQASRMGLHDGLGIATVMAYFVGYARLAEADAERFRRCIAPAFMREDSPGGVVLALARHGLAVAATQDAYAAQLLTQIDAVRLAFAR